MKRPIEEHILKSVGKEFAQAGTSNSKNWLPIVVQTRGTTRTLPELEQSFVVDSLPRNKQGRIGYQGSCHVGPYRLGESLSIGNRLPVKIH